MSARKTTKSAKKHSARGPSSIVWFEVPADRPERAKTFYSKLFGWKIKKFPGMEDYWHIDTGGPDATPDGGMYPRKTPQQAITNYVAVPSVDVAAAKVTQLGGKICMAKTPVPGMGFFAICQDTEDNTFAIWERNGGAK